MKGLAENQSTEQSEVSSAGERAIIIVLFELRSALLIPEGEIPFTEWID